MNRNLETVNVDVLFSFFKGIDSIISIYENGVQLAFTRQPHTAVFFPIASLLYCSSVRFSEVINDQTSSIDWKFLPLNPTELNTDSKHPPIFSLVTHRTKTAPIDECHCFITKNVEASLALVQNVTEIYSGIRSINEMVRCPIFYQVCLFFIFCFHVERNNRR